MFLSDDEPERMWKETVAPASFSARTRKFLTPAMSVNYGPLTEFGTPR